MCSLEVGLGAILCSSLNVFTSLERSVILRARAMLYVSMIALNLSEPGDSYS